MTCTIYTELSSARKGSSLFSDLTHTRRRTARRVRAGI